ncbi:MAG: hypothetical protein QGI33_00160 [Candidatus Brocadiia bacterium]|jgi:hypothetical protein|nr:hypothetical protein [Candidatus Brocadiia bacterium]
MQIIAFWELNVTVAALVGVIAIVAACFIAVRAILAATRERRAARTALMLGALLFFVGLGGILACPVWMWWRAIFAALMALGGLTATVTLVDRYYGEK